LSLNETDLSLLNIFHKMSDYNTKYFIFTIFFLSLPVPGHEDWTDQIPIIKDVWSFCGCILSNSISSLTVPNHPCRSMSLVRSWKLQYRAVQFNPPISNLVTVGPQFDKPQYNKVLGTTNDFLQPVHNNSKMYGTEPRYDEPRFNVIIIITNKIQKGKHKMHLHITNLQLYVNMWQKLNAKFYVP